MFLRLGHNTSPLKRLIGLKIKSPLPPLLYDCSGPTRCTFYVSCSISLNKLQPLPCEEPGPSHHVPDPPAGQVGDAEPDVNVLLYVGLGMGAVGLVITFVGIGEKGFKSLQLKLAGPGLVGCGIILTIIR